MNGNDVIVVKSGSRDPAFCLALSSRGEQISYGRMSAKASALKRGKRVGRLTYSMYRFSDTRMTKGISAELRLM